MGDVYGWTGKLLRVDLSNSETSLIDTMHYVPQFIGGLGIAARIAWEELLPGVGPFDPENMLFIMVGPLTGTLASGAGRVEVLGIAPQQHPPVFSRSGMGGHWGAELKYAGYDGVVIQGKAEKPVYIWINDGEVEIRDASSLWGVGTFGVTKALRNVHGPKTRIVSCGQAGERLSRIAVIQTETGNAAGQGGFGAVMGSKNLKAIAVRGTQGVKIAKPRQFFDLCMNASHEGQTPSGGGFGEEPTISEAAAAAGKRSKLSYRIKKCGFCRTPCVHRVFMGVPGKVTSGQYTVARHCWAYESIGARGDVEARSITSDYGINGWEISYGMIPWLQMCKQHGLINDIDGVDIPVPDKPIGYLSDCADYTEELVNILVHKIAHREGELGDALAEGTCYAADRLFDGKGKPLLDRIYPRHGGQTQHWLGHWGPGGNVYWPWWLPPVLQWCVDTRDPANDSTHQWTEHAQFYLPQSGPYRGPFSLEKTRAVCAKVYGNADVCDPAFEYDPPEAKAIPALWHSVRGMIIDSLILCDYENTRVFSMLSEDGAADTALMSKLFSASTGFETSEQELDLAGARIWTLLRVTPDRDKLLALLDTYYEISGWNPANGWPTRNKLEALGLQDVADDLESRGKLG
jgi:aldehyde:ferredoxin oxidoreductase